MHWGRGWKGWYYTIAHALKEEVLEERWNSSDLEKTVKSEGEAFSWDGRGGTCSLQAPQRLFYCQTPGPIQRLTLSLIFSPFFSAADSWVGVYLFFLLAIAKTPFPPKVSDLLKISYGVGHIPIVTFPFSLLTLKISKHHLH